MNLTHQLKKSPDFVWDYLSDMQKFVIVHPIIYKIEPLSNGDYLVYEKLTVGFIPAKFTYIVSLNTDHSAKRIRYKANVKGMTKIEMQFDISEEGEGSLVNETVSFKTFLPIKGILKNIFTTQHKLLFANIERL